MRTPTIHSSDTGDYVLPCDVKLPPATTIAKGCTLSTLIAALKVREKGWPEVSAEQVAAVSDMLKAEYADVDWQTVEEESGSIKHQRDILAEWLQESYAEIEQLQAELATSRDMCTKFESAVADDLGEILQLRAQIEARAYWMRQQTDVMRKARDYIEYVLTVHGNDTPGHGLAALNALDTAIAGRSQPGVDHA